MAIHHMPHWKNAGKEMIPTLDNLFTDIVGLKNRPRSLSQVPDYHAYLIGQAVGWAYSSQECRMQLEADILHDIYANGGEYELLSQMPQPKRERKPRPKRTLVESRADRAALKVAEWERKLKLAKTKLAKYRAKAKRYAQKGVEANA
jgi:hypothetical protein